MYVLKIAEYENCGTVCHFALLRKELILLDVRSDLFVPLVYRCSVIDTSSIFPFPFPL